MSDFNDMNNGNQPEHDVPDESNKSVGERQQDSFIPQQQQKETRSDRSYASYSYRENNGNQSTDANRYSYSYRSPVDNGGKPDYFYNSGNNGNMNYNGNFSQQPSRPSGGGQKLGKTVLICIVCALAVVSLFISAYSVRRSRQAVTADGTVTATAEDASELTVKSKKTDNTAVTTVDSGDSNEISKVGSGEDGNGESLSPKDIYKKIKDASVGVLISSESIKPSNSNITGEGSGVIVDVTDKYTYIITCAHVVADGGVISVQLSDESQYEAQLVGSDARSDIAVLRIEKTGLTKIEIGDSDLLEVGETVYAIGNPGGVDFAGSFTNGMVSAIARPISSEIGYQMVCIQHTAAINPGNSGGALVNEQGQLVGINSSKIASTDYEGMGFSVPSSTFVKVYNEIIKHGYVTNRPKLGIRYYPAAADQTAAMLIAANNLPSGSILIDSIDSESALSGKDVRAGDFIIKVNGKELDDVNYLPELVEKSKVGDELTLTICRFDSNYKMTQFDVTVKLIEDRGTSYSSSETTTQAPQDYFDPFEFFGYGNGY